MAPHLLVDQTSVLRSFHPVGRWLSPVAERGDRLHACHAGARGSWAA